MLPLVLPKRKDWSKEEETKEVGEEGIDKTKIICGN